MIFIRVTVSHTRNAACAVHAQDTPYEQGGFALLSNEDCDTFDLGLIEDTDASGQLITWRDRDGLACRPCRQILHRLEDMKIGSKELLAHAVLPHAPDPRPHPLAAALGLREIVDTPCTLDAIRHRLRRHGHRAMNPKVRAWLALTLPEHHVDALGLSGAPLAALKAMERVRVRRDPHAGSRVAAIERLVQEASNQRSAKALAARRQKPEG